MPDITKRSFTLIEGKHYKFWTVQTRGKFFFATWGKIGTKGQTQTKEFPSAYKAEEYAYAMIAEKKGKGYTEDSPGGVGRHAGAPDHLLESATGRVVAAAVPTAELEEVGHVHQRGLDL